MPYDDDILPHTFVCKHSMVVSLQVAVQKYKALVERQTAKVFLAIEVSVTGCYANCIVAQVINGKASGKLLIVFRPHPEITET